MGRARKKAPPEKSAPAGPGGSELYALQWSVPEMLSREADFAREAVAGIQEADVPDWVRQDVRAAAGSVNAHLHLLQEHLARGAIGQAVLAAFEVGRSSQMIARQAFTHLVIGGDKAQSAHRTARREKEAKTNTRRQAILAAVRFRLKMHPRDSVDYARKAVAWDHLCSGGNQEPGWSYASIRRATLGMKKTKRK